MQNKVTAMNLEISEDISEDLKEFFEQQASIDVGGGGIGHNANNDLITYDD
ncbi:hypothetical protein ABN154_28630 [Klebsiella michiganensis]|uniref:hypothetical protein n=1 Tax=Klebsiella michiganensis TaxID=1134687 RepID=UPI0032DB6BFA